MSGPAEVPGPGPHLDLGDVEVTAILGGRLRLDGGAMFGVVPRPLWQQVAVPDSRNRVANACRCLLVRSGDAAILVDSGCGEGFDDKARDLYALDPAIRLVDALRQAGQEPEALTHVIFTHLHFDHAAGALCHDGDGRRPAFPQALHVVQRGEFEDARTGRSITRSSYLPQDLRMLADSVRWELIAGSVDYLPGLRLEVTGGHTEHHQAIIVEGTEGGVLFAGDILPTRAHLRPYWIMAYDMFPHQTLVVKQELARRAASAGWTVAWDHDPEVPFSRLADDGRGAWGAEALAS